VKRLKGRKFSFVKKSQISLSLLNSSIALSVYLCINLHFILLAHSFLLCTLILLYKHKWFWFSSKHPEYGASI
jgi:hypothetical protein